jgi:hypothetical protein
MPRLLVYVGRAARQHFAIIKGRKALEIMPRSAHSPAWATEITR